MKAISRDRPGRERSGVGVLHKTLDILETLKDGEGGVRLADLVRKVEMPKATVYRILTTLETRGYLDRGEDGGYRMAKKFFDLRRDVPLEQVLQQAARCNKLLSPGCTNWWNPRRRRSTSAFSMPAR